MVLLLDDITIGKKTSRNPIHRELTKSYNAPRHVMEILPRLCATTAYEALANGSRLLKTHTRRSSSKGRNIYELFGVTGEGKISWMTIDLLHKMMAKVEKSRSALSTKVALILISQNAEAYKIAAYGCYDYEPAKLLSSP